MPFLWGAINLDNAKILFMKRCKRSFGLDVIVNENAFDGYRCYTAKTEQINFD